MANIRVDQMAAEINNILADWKDGVLNVTDEAVRDAVNQARREVRAESPRGDERPASQSYAQHWRTAFVSRGLVRRGIVYNTKYPLTHILEYGHAKLSGGRTEAQRHIEPAANDAAARFERLLKGGIENL